ncbi:MAG TPA: hypothetical protein VK020_04145 [Microlunatus sp.]|nr:hypothetical protein [Microlunatus sp.]
MVVLLRRAVFGGWHGLPALAVGTALVGLAQVLVALLTPGLTPLTLVALVLVSAPATGLLVGAAVRALAGDEVTVLDVVRSASRVAPRAMAVVAVPVLFAGLLLAAGEVWRRTGQPLVLLPYGLSGAAVLILVLATVVALPLALRRPDLSLRRIWLVALAATARQPLPPLGALAVAVIGHWVATTLYWPLWWLVPLPVALLAALASALLTDPAAGRPAETAEGLSSPGPAT